MSDQGANNTTVALVSDRRGYRYLTVYGVTVQATGTPSLWSAMERLAEAINTAASAHSATGVVNEPA